MQIAPAIDTIKPKGGLPLSTFAKLQAAGWGGYFLLHWLGALSRDEPAQIFWSALANAMMGLILSSLMRPFLLRAWRGPAAKAAVVAMILSLLFAVPFAVVSELVYWWSQGRGWLFHLDTPLEYLGSAFWCGSVLMTWAAIYFGLAYYHQSQEQEKLLNKSLAAVRQAKLDALRHQLNPHFLFNSLNGISTLVLEQRNDQAQHMIEQLSGLLRTSLESDSRHQVSVGEELELLQRYLDIEHARFSDRLKITVDVDAAARPKLIPTFLLQPLVENCVQHALEPSLATVTISVKITQVDGKLQICVSDRSSGPAHTDQKSAHPGVGLNNIQERLKLLYGEDFSMRAGPTQDGWSVAIILPAT